MNALALNSLVNLFVAADALAFVGTLSSNWGRLVLMLSWGKYGSALPCASLDQPFWVARFGFGACTWAPHVAAGLAEVWLLAIRRSHARKGLGSLLLRAVEARLLADGVRCAVACAGHDTVPFWRRVGYASLRVATR